MIRPTDVERSGGADQGDRHPGRLADAVRAGTGDDVQREGALEDVDARGHRRLVECPLDLGAAAIATRVDDPAVAVAALAGERRALAFGVRIERRAQAHQVPDRCRRLGDELAHHRLVAQPGAGGEGVADVVLE